MSQNKTTNKTNSTKTSRSRTSSPTTVSKRTASKEPITPEVVAPEASTPEVTTAELLPSEVPTEDANEILPVKKEELLTAVEVEVASDASEASDVERSYEAEMDSGGEPETDENPAQGDGAVQAEDAIESSTSDTNEDEMPSNAGVSEAAEVPALPDETQDTTEDAPEPSSGDTGENAEAVVQTPHEAKPADGAEKPIEKVKGLDRQLRATSPRYAAACAEVGRLRKGFLYALNRKAAILGVERVGEAVPVKNQEIDAIDAEIREARQKLEDLIARKKQLKGASPELDEVNSEIREISRLRQAARIEKRAAYGEAVKAAAL
jgi:hypothetical protein